MAVWSVLKLRIELLEFFKPALGNPRTDYGLLLVHVL